MTSSFLLVIATAAFSWLIVAHSTTPQTIAAERVLIDTQKHINLACSLPGELAELASVSFTFLNHSYHDASIWVSLCSINGNVRWAHSISALVMHA